MKCYFNSVIYPLDTNRIYPLETNKTWGKMDFTDLCYFI